MVHGETALQSAIRASEAMFGGDLYQLELSVLEDVFSDVPHAEVSINSITEDQLLLDLLVNTGILGSKGEGKRLIKNGGLYLNNERVTEEGFKVNENYLLGGKLLVIRFGKKDYRLLQFIR
jgi:tyrosyl-tRNA synthetase